MSRRGAVPRSLTRGTKVDLKVHLSELAVHFCKVALDCDVEDGCSMPSARLGCSPYEEAAHWYGLALAALDFAVPGDDARLRQLTSTNEPSECAQVSKGRTAAAPGRSPSTLNLLSSNSTGTNRRVAPRTCGARRCGASHLCESSRSRGPGRGQPWRYRVVRCFTK